MNKLLVKDSKLDINNEMANIAIGTNNLTINVFGSVCINDYHNDTDLALQINLNPGAKLLYNRYNANVKNFSLGLRLGSDSYAEFNYSLETTLESSLVLGAKITGSSSTSKINFHGVTSENGIIKATATSEVIKDTKDNEVLENLRILALNDAENMIVPNLLVKTDSVNAIHNTTISSVSKDYLFYLNSKGINDTDAIQLIKNGFLKSNLK